MDLVKSEPTSEGETYPTSYDSNDKMVDMKEEEVPPVIFLQVKTESQASIVLPFFNILLRPKKH
jgi:hypothetical protein